jgi:hypothetical protein
MCARWEDLFRLAWLEGENVITKDVRLTAGQCLIGPDAHQALGVEGGDVDRIVLTYGPWVWKGVMWT